MVKTKQQPAATDVTQITGEPTAGDVEQLQIKLAEIAVKFDTGLFQGGDELGHIRLVVSEAEYQREIADETWTYTTPEKPGTFDPNLARQLEVYCRSIKLQNMKDRFMSMNYAKGCKRDCERKF